MTVTLRPITAENWQQCIALRTMEAQEQFVASNLFLLAQSKFQPDRWPHGIYADETMVGFVLYGRKPGDDRYWITHVMVDATYQGKGYGRAAMEAVIARLVTEPYCNEIVLAYNKENLPARRLYAHLGFREIEVLDDAFVSSLDIKPFKAARQAEIPVVTIVEGVNEEDEAYLARQIRAFNDSQSAPHRLARQPEHSPKPLHIFLKDADGIACGGLTGQTVWDWLEIDYLWLDEQLRGRDYGTELMQRAEAEAKRRGCTHVVVGTFSFQARGFYEKLGYRIVGALEDHPPGAADYWLRKDFLDGSD
ncbi:MAG: GNAT family N-acetyltransferase [Thermomicrobiales bacterium]